MFSPSLHLDVPKVISEVACAPDLLHPLLCMIHDPDSSWHALAYTHLHANAQTRIYSFARVRSVPSPFVHYRVPASNKKVCPQKPIHGCIFQHPMVLCSASQPALLRTLCCYLCSCCIPASPSPAACFVMTRPDWPASVTGYRYRRCCYCYLLASGCVAPNAEMRI